MKNALAALLALAAGIGVSAAGRRLPSAERADRVERGRYLVRSIGCGDCHSPKKVGSDGMPVMGPGGPIEDEDRVLSGHPEKPPMPPPPVLPAGPWMATASWDLTAWSGPWGVSYTMNLTPDENTGIGSWSEETFVDALRTGRHMGAARPILPPMPWPAFRNLSDDDLKAVYAYLRTIRPVKNRVPEPLPPAAQD